MTETEVASFVAYIKKIGVTFSLMLFQRVPRLHNFVAHSLAWMGFSGLTALRFNGVSTGIFPLYSNDLSFLVCHMVL